MSSEGLRNWRGEIIQSKATTTASSESVANKGSSPAHGSKSDPSSPPSDDRHPAQKKVLRKDEFGRDVEVVVDEKSRKRSKVERKEDRKKERKHKHKHKKKHKHHRDKSSDRSRSSSPRGRLVGTPPPADPFRPQLDEDRGRRLHRRTHHRNRSRSRSIPRKGYSRRHSRSRSRGDDRPTRWSCSRSRSRSRGRHRSPSSPPSRSHHRHSLASVERKWTHNAFDDRSPSPPRRVDPLYRPEPETWVSRAGGVYLPRK
ncbi:hypothetical protein F441_00830 [Phytophthora nicotianae CJ01A1]|uniref:Uncharacterized protein n=5 Tax=Phytophthora nicotianae TaxID=4792 RepID=V9G0Z3_PHYNI|nr:hypothetical protein F443_00846 [Phytophthora nicotianae P1569]ETK96512.1 hypothetical protein L915_00790 [Phytophthora nicotianae]ETO85455.1 hypothetical protein F444_00820 [Phytophthora nicotianae P1976]ETP26549.1 hypothetical protein F441_00830 [Phytophthora nicotianae CJ01A1]ETP54522.1 hypothetical protein F442_00801 [Phytophthora nicotianae P10297]